MLTIESFATNLETYLEPALIQQVRRAYDFAKEAHKGQKRESGEPYITHPLAVASILADMHMDHQCLMAALMHDVIEDTGIPKHTIGKEFDEEVADLVDGVSKLNTTLFDSRATAQAENFQKMALAMAKDIRVILVKLADRLHNMQTLGALEGEQRRRIARETLEIYAPIAYRLGMNTVRIELEELGFRALYPLRSSMIEKAVNRARGNRKEVIANIRESISACLERDGIQSEVFGRQKHLYSIYDKMRSKHKSFYEIMDVYGFRIIVDSVDNCYRTLGSMHNLYKPVAGRFKDYIAIPKANGYQSLHTTLFGMHGLPIEIQVRTPEMETLANDGIAGHWLYKSNDESGSSVRTREWIRDLLEIQQSAGSSLEFIENVKIDLFPDEVYIFTPVGDIYDLAQGSTPIDFAYAVHTDIGNKCVACRIDRRLAPLSATLESGQTVEIITAPGAQPNPAWLNFAISGKARSSIRHALKHQRKSESIALGHRLLERTLESYDTSLETIPAQKIQTALDDRNIESLDELLSQIGLGNQIAYVIAKQLVTENTGQVEDIGPLAIMGSEGLIVTYARCCKPIPGDPVMGHVSAGRGIVIHIDNCKNILHQIQDKPDEVMAIRWDDTIDQEFSVELRLELEHAKGIIAIIASYITNEDANIEGISMIEKDARLGIINVTISVRDRVHLAQVIKRLRLLKAITRIIRVRS